MLLFRHPLVDIAGANEGQWLVVHRRTDSRSSSRIWRWATGDQTAFPRRTFDTCRGRRTARRVQWLRDLARVAEFSHAPATVIWAPSVWTDPATASTRTGVAILVVNGSARAELPLLRIHSTVKAGLPLQLLLRLLVLVSSIVVVIIIATPIVSVIVVGLGLSPFLGSVAAWDGFERDGLLALVLARLRHDSRWVCGVAECGRLLLFHHKVRGHRAKEQVFWARLKLEVLGWVSRV